MTDFKKLQNGSDIRGVAIETEGGKPVNLTQNSVVRIGAAFALFAADRANKPASELRIAIGRDSRLSGEQLTVWLADGIASVGANAYDGGLASTPAMFMCCVNELHFDAGIMVTASHLPMERNGMKFFTAIAGGLEKADITAILASAEEAAFPIAAQRGQCGTVDVMTPYVNGLKEKILSALGCAKDEKPFSGLKIVVDAGNGAGGFFAERLLEPLGADITGSRFLEPDGRFPNHQPNPENAEAMRSICDAVTETGADFGIIFDTDVDRAGAVLPSDGGVIALDRNIPVLCFVSKNVKKEKSGANFPVSESVPLLFGRSVNLLSDRTDKKTRRNRRAGQSVFGSARFYARERRNEWGTHRNAEREFSDC